MYLHLEYFINIQGYIMYIALCSCTGPCGVLQDYNIQGYIISHGSLWCTSRVHYALCIMYYVHTSRVQLEYTMVHYVYRTVFLHGSLPSWEPKSIVLLLLPPKPGEAPNLPKHTTEIGFLFTLVIAPHKYRSFWKRLFQAFVKY